MLFHQAFHDMSKSFNYILSQYQLDTTTFCNMNTNYFYDLIQNHYHEGLDEKLLNTVSFAKDVFYNIENAYSTSFFTKHELLSLLSV